MNHMQIGRVGIVGANATSSAIALGLAEAGIPVTLFDAERASLDKVLAEVRSGGRERCMALLAATVNFHHLKDCDLLIDTGEGDRAGKEAVFRRLDQVARLGAILATCRPELGLDAIAGCTRRSGEVIGLLVGQSAPTVWGVVPTRHTSADTLGALNALLQHLQDAVRPALAA
ncbi:3-hydroxyacyl-CoA dehydrogenase NAD-binding domain-containing protein [Massilia norwichensis]|uniref:3-hydroxyacyl-CoA dehydrogenase NAD-binding domain-containing protein n=1 Tax=Massilia norwichensis TaxID=1442366 RepID=A0ABT2A0Y0_9BURK|nr:3-hydroxyacyl-CoA dehydrogenase NAD-binding domain-containing protein [Massilia norwichensis]MCS0587834.1 3-hydroxyacyl-CoA dehydrogenase NAD-binding domain-containing protein [Massilia norwichensis]